MRWRLVRPQKWTTSELLKFYILTWAGLLLGSTPANRHLVTNECPESVRQVIIVRSASQFFSWPVLVSDNCISSFSTHVRGRRALNRVRAEWQFAAFVTSVCMSAVKLFRIFVNTSVSTFVSESFIGIDLLSGIQHSTFLLVMDSVSTTFMESQTNKHEKLRWTKLKKQIWPKPIPSWNGKIS